MSNHESKEFEILREGSPPPTCHVSCIMCHMSYAKNFSLLFLDKIDKLVGGGSFIKGKPHLVLICQQVFADISSTFQLRAMRPSAH